jgi:hypothetical protein
MNPTSATAATLIDLMVILDSSVQRAQALNDLGLEILG